MEAGVGIIGLGTVGGSVYKVLNQNQEKIEKEVGLPVRVKKVFDLNQKRYEELSVPLEQRANSVEEVLNEREVSIVVELIGKIEPAKTIILDSLKRGKSVVTANKELLALHGEELLSTAAKNGVDLLFEASVGGGIPIIKPLKESLAGNRVQEVMGIVNGTTNYILSRMSEESCSFAEALKEAQEKGYAEADPSADIEGRDAASKIAILASIAFNSRVLSTQVYCEGISKVTAQDIKYAKELGFVIKLLAVGKEENGLIDVRVHPALIPVSHPLASVEKVYNAIYVKGNVVGEVMFFGPGAGGFAAASSVVGDIIDIARNLKFKCLGKVGCTCFESKVVRPIEDLVTRYYILMEVLDRPGVLASIAGEFGKAQVSLASVIQKETFGERAELVFMTHKTIERSLRQAIEAIKKLPVVSEVKNVIRVEGEE